MRIIEKKEKRKEGRNERRKDTDLREAQHTRAIVGLTVNMRQARGLCTAKLEYKVRFSEGLNMKEKGKQK